ncbi:MAG: hypothetical protein IJW03_02345 [Clostridia bacterium]|nr:hypothetical protein [Clostridia bacterium]
MKKVLTLTIAVVMLFAMSVLLASCDSGEKSTACEGCEVGNPELEVSRKNPSCVEIGYIEYKCLNGCMNHIVILEATGHTEGEWKIDKEATCTEEGSKHNNCVDCGKLMQNKVVIEAYGHNYTWTTTVEPTCDYVGYEDGICTVCGDQQLNVEMEAIGHAWGDEQTTPATCVVPGEKYMICGNCESKVQTDVIEPSHVMETVIDLEATCAVPGSKHEECQREGCDYATAAVEIPVTDHTMVGDWIIDNDATCTAPGSKHYVCTVCTQPQTADIPVKGHNYEDTVVAPTCTADGYTKHVCSREECGDTYTDTPTPATGHDGFDTALTSGKCSKCDAQLYTVEIKYQLADGTSVSEKADYAYDGDVSGIEIASITGYSIVSTKINTIADYKVEVIVICEAIA